jgi:uncharacterized caspase-like protein
LIMDEGQDLENRRPVTFRHVLLAVALIAATQILAEQQGTDVGSSRGAVLSATVDDEVPLYAASYALLIGISDYTAGWPDLETVPAEMGRVAAALTGLGFQVEQQVDPDARKLREVFQRFIDTHGYQRDSRLLIYFSGHGHSWEKRGYLVPSDAPLPTTQADFPGEAFLRKALPMTQIVAWGRQMTAKHVLFLFDSCFSGTIFSTKGLPQPPAHLSRLMQEPVRQYITAGSVGEEVPARSVFSAALVDAITSDVADLYQDGYLTGTELGLYLQSVVSQHSQQTPQFGKGPDYELARGEFFFSLKPSPDDVSVSARDRAETGAPVLAGQQTFATWRGGECLYAARVIDQQAKRCLVHYQFGAVEWVTAEQLVDAKSPRPGQLRVGSRVFVRLDSTQDRWVPGNIAEQRGDKFLIVLSRQASCRGDQYHAWAFATDLLLR